MAPLPPTIPTKLTQRSNYANIKSAYDRCLREERRLMERRDQGPNTQLRLVSIRILGCLIHHAPTDVAVGTVVKEIHSCKEDADLYDVGDLYLRALTRAFKAAKGQTPAPSNHASRPSFDTLSDMIKDYLEPAPLSHTTAKKNALARDGFRCVVSAKYDLASIQENSELKKKYLSGELPFKDVTHTQCAHIFSESTNVGIEPESDKLDWASSMWAVMTRFGYTSLPDDLNGPNIHRLENIMTLQGDIHKLFDSLSIWFVATNTEHTYRIETIPDHAPFALEYPTVSFTTSKPGLALPSPEYLAIHAACAKVAHLSGASEWFRKYDHDEEEHFHKTLATDGNSASLLHNLLWVHASQGDTMA
ncbi:hypothetical protein D9619_008090 [Psilocybe cf. subviscida]|uniref:HNH nuclease domain-containing protein n=1 Tax=Psilocybe cf. subviscida TaxID=2480587 RepID=A0A8H5ESP1_9AGAR|nr:hypothetical protein D9619_008090 [Psilocybe cf. subviscida]